MVTNQITFADASAAQQALSLFYPNAKHIELVEHGYDNIVGLVDEKYAVRFPRNINAYKRSQYEKSVLSSIDNIADVQIPKVLAERTYPPCLITTFVDGSHLSPDDVNNFSNDEQITFGESVGKFAYDLHSSLSVGDARHFREKLGLDSLAEEPWDIFLENTLNKTTFPTQKQDELAKLYYASWKKCHSEANQVVVHDDLHTENMLFKEQELVGVIDFGDTNIGTAEQELRQLYRINDMVLRAAVDKYNQLSRQSLDIEAIKLWAIAQELSAYSVHIATNNTDHPAFAKAVKNLNKWLPEGKWGNGLKVTDQPGQ